MQLAEKQYGPMFAKYAGTELRQLAAAGAKVIQIEEPTIHFTACFHPEEKELLDFMVDDIRRVEAQLPKEEKQKLERYRDAFQSIATRQSRLGDIDPSRIHPATKDSDSKVETDRLRAHFDMAATDDVNGP